MSGTHKFYTLPEPSARKGFSSLKLKEGPVPRPEANEVLIKVHAVSLNFRDLIIAQNGYPLHLKQEELIPASDGAGEIVSVGNKVTKWKQGDRVAGIFTQAHQKGSTPDKDEIKTALGGSVDGMLAQYVALPDTGIVRIPSHLSFEEAATLPCAALTAYNALYGIPTEQLRAGDTIVAQGTGGVSVFALQLASAAGAKTIITSSSDDKLKKALSLIPQHLQHLVTTVNYKTNPDWDKVALEVTNGAGVDHVVEVGGPGTLEKSFNSIKRGGVISTIGFVAQGEPPNVAYHALLTGAYFKGILVGSREQFEHMNQIIEDHQIKPLVDKVFPFEKAEEAYAYQWSQAHVGKVVINVSH
ncbi:Alcohol dehydrogenase GroES-like protein [Kalmanozyma brasiliensis GHG001]|uniref:Putative Alcohol dehydrogenase n=1 Tax=Kalmanozyma brasiliensis (strain GHG001) TaxID=1365824 RepID=V5ERP6_KALBG|nr:Alcohol dehydrogenase GroES-like protein [Kalmanozyma brasiliensis GHG001]EST07830.1 Alcohol dehydrogenase GroES-like protein [Kalmanozyma brasiliensis GHG001]